MDDRSDILDRIRGLRTYRIGDRRAPHKPLLVLYAIAQLQRGERKLSCDNINRALSPLLAAYAPPVKNGRHQPELPYWHLATDGIWAVRDANDLDRQASGFPKMAALRASVAGFPDNLADQLSNDNALLQAVVKHLLSEHFAMAVCNITSDGSGVNECRWTIGQLACESQTPTPTHAK